MNQGARQANEEAARRSLQNSADRQPGLWSRLRISFSKVAQGLREKEAEIERLQKDNEWLRACIRVQARELLEIAQAGQGEANETKHG